MKSSPSAGPPAREPTPGAPESAPVVRSPGPAPRDASSGAQADRGAPQASPGPAPAPQARAPLVSSDLVAVAAEEAAAATFTFAPRDPSFQPQRMVLVRDRDRIEELIHRYPGAAFWSWRAFWRYFRSMEDVTADRVAAFDPEAVWPPLAGSLQKNPGVLQKIQADSRLDLAQINLLKIEFGPRGVALLDTPEPARGRADSRDRSPGAPGSLGPTPTPAGAATTTEPGSVHYSRPAKYRGKRKPLRP